MIDLASDATGLIVLFVAVIIGWRLATATGRALRRALAGAEPEDVITGIVAVLATAIASQGMLNAFGDYLAMPAWMRWCGFSLFELAMLACALRGRRKIRDPLIGTAGIDGVLVWVMASISAVFSASDASGWGALARMCFPFIAAGAWELLLAYQRRRSGARTIHWRITPERVLVRLGIAEASDRTATDVDAHRRITRLAKAAKRVRILQAAGVTGRELARALRRLDTAMEAATEHAGLATDPDRQDELWAQLGALYNASALAEANPEAPWATVANRAQREPGDPRELSPKQRALRSRLILEEVRAARVLPQREFVGVRPEVRTARLVSVPPAVPGDVPGESAPEPPKKEEPQDRDQQDTRDEDVPAPVPEELRRLVSTAQRRFQQKLSTGRRPTVRELKKSLGIGTDRAREVRPYLVVPEQERSA